MATKKYVSLSKLQTFLDNLSSKFAALTHTHTISEISDLGIDSQLSSTSTNPVANSVLDAEFEAISEAMGALETSIDGKADGEHTHTISDITNLQDTIDTINETIYEKSGVQVVTATSTDGKAYTATCTNLTIETGTRITIIPNMDSTATNLLTLRINGQSSSTYILRKNGTGLTAKFDVSPLKANSPYTLTYNGSSGFFGWIMDRYEVVDAIPVPTTATVSQTIRVSEVDENGKPTAWEAVDMPTQVQIVTWGADD